MTAPRSRRKRSLNYWQICQNSFRISGTPVGTPPRGSEAVIFCRPAGSNIEKRLAKLVSTAHGTARSPTGLENSPPNGSVHRLHPGENEKRKNSQALCPIGSPPRAVPLEPFTWSGWPGGGPEWGVCVVLCAHG